MELTKPKQTLRERKIINLNKLLQSMGDSDWRVILLLNKLIDSKSIVREPVTLIVRSVLEFFARVLTELVNDVVSPV